MIMDNDGKQEYCNVTTRALIGQGPEQLPDLTQCKEHLCILFSPSLHLSVSLSTPPHSPSSPLPVLFHSVSLYFPLCSFLCLVAYLSVCAYLSDCLTLSISLYPPLSCSFSSLSNPPSESLSRPKAVQLTISWARADIWCNKKKSSNHSNRL